MASAEFLDKCSDIYQSLLQSQRSPRDPVVVPTSGSDDTRIHLNNHHPADGVDSMQFFRAMYPLCDRMNYRSECSQTCLKRALLIFLMLNLFIKAKLECSSCTVSMMFRLSHDRHITIKFSIFLLHEWPLRTGLGHKAI